MVKHQQSHIHKLVITATHTVLLLKENMFSLNAKMVMKLQNALVIHSKLLYTNHTHTQVTA